MDSFKNNITQINNIEYIYNVVLFNADDKAIVFSQDAIELLVIEDSITTPFASGAVVIRNDNNAIQRSFKRLNSDGEFAEVEAAFEFNTGDRDYLYVEIIPKFFPTQQYGDLTHKVWNLSYLFAIYDTEEVDSAGAGKSAKKFYFVDHQKFEMMDKVSTFSTATMARETTIAQYKRDDNDRSETTGKILKDIITQSTTESIFDDEWDTSGNVIFYTSPANSDYLADMEYIYDIHQSSPLNDFCILSKERYTKIWSLESFSSIVSKALQQNNKTKAGEYQMEAFVIADVADMPQIPLKTRVPDDYGVDKNVSFGDLSKIDSFKMVEISRQDINNEFKTRVAHSYDFSDGRFRINHYDISDTKQFFKENYSDKLIGKDPIFKIGDNQLKNRNIEYVYGSTYDSTNTFEFLSRNEILKSAYLMGLGIEFSGIGMTNRRAGTFFSIRKEHNFYNNEFEGKLQGQWYCTNVTHVFSGNTYTTNMVGVKLNTSTV